MFNFFLTLLSGQTPDAVAVTSTAGAIERGGLYSIIAILMGTVVYLYLSKEKQRDQLHSEFQALQSGFQAKLLQLVEDQTKLITKQVVLTEKVESLLDRVTTDLNRRAQKE